MRHTTVILVLFLTALAGPALALIGAPPVAGDVSLVIVPPWRDAVGIIEAAGGAAIGPGSAPLAALAVGAAPDFVARLVQEGAWIVRDGAALAQICGMTP